MALQLKGDNQDNVNHSDSSGDTMNALDKKNSDPWGNKDIEDNIYRENLVRMKEEAHVVSTHYHHRQIRLIIGLLSIVIIIGLIYFGKNYISEMLNPTITDLTPYISMDEKQIARELDVEFTDGDEWLTGVLSWIDDGKRQLGIYSNEDLGVFFLDGRQMGIFVHQGNYKLYNMQIGMGDKDALDITTYSFEKPDYFVVKEDMDDDSKNTTYYYYNKDNNDCIGITKNDTTNIVEGIIYINNYQIFSKDIK